MFLLIIKAVYFVLPAYLANMSPVLFDKLGWLKFLNRPIDGGKIFLSNRLFGENKTWRGLVSGIIFGILVAGVQKILLTTGYTANISIFNYENWLIFGFLAGAGAIIGDLIKSFFKRRIGLKAGATWPVFDQLDFVIGFFIFTKIIYSPGWEIILTITFLTLILHPLSNIIGYWLGWKKVWW